LALLVFLLLPLARARGDATLLLEEPYGRLGFFTGTGHIAVYLNRVCADVPLVVRRCAAGENGVVIARYNKIAGYDWIAIPLLPYLYAVEYPDEVPLLANPKLVAFLRNEYRKRHLEEIAPDDESSEPPAGNWTQLAGAVYDRTIYGFTIETSEEQDDRLVAALNSEANRSRYRSLTQNCADFVREIINFYYPKALHRNVVADLGISTPKQMAKSLVKFGLRHPELHSARFVIPQVPGTIPRSTAAHGVAESLLKSKKYVLPLIAVQPILAGCVAAAYVGGGRFDPERDAMVLTPGSRPQPPLASDERRIYESRLNLLLARTGAEENSGQSAKAWVRLQASAQPQLDESGKPVLQLRVGEKLVDLGISRGNILTTPASSTLAGTALAARLHWELRRSDATVSARSIASDWSLLEQVLPPLRADLN
jgi:hypothetical protein